MEKKKKKKMVWEKFKLKRNKIFLMNVFTIIQSWGCLQEGADII